MAEPSVVDCCEKDYISAVYNEGHCMIACQGVRLLSPNLLRGTGG
jgi:hypothetical protein